MQKIMVGEMRQRPGSRLRAASGIENAGRGAFAARQSIGVGNGAHAGLVPPGGAEDKGNMRVIPFLAASVGAAARSVVDYALPPRCPGCGAIVGEADRFCVECWGKLRFLGEPCCARCGLPFEVDPGPGALCGACVVDPPPWTSARAAMGYDAVARAVALRLKYGRRVALARLMAHHMAAHLPDAARDEPDRALLVPVPLHRARLWRRGFNQALLIAREIGRTRGIAVDPLTLCRVKATQPLHRLGPKARERMVAGAFALAPARRDRLKGRTILLVDDIHTSGATARACTRVLLRGGAEAVHLLCWARALPHDAEASSGLLD